MLSFFFLFPTSTSESVTATAAATAPATSTVSMSPSVHIWLYDFIPGTYYIDANADVLPDLYLSLSLGHAYEYCT